MHYIIDLLEQMLAAGVGAVEVRQEVHDAYNRRVDAAHERMVWTHPGMATYYRNSRGRVVVTDPVPRRGLLAHDPRGGPRTTTSSSPPSREEVRS